MQPGRLPKFLWTGGTVLAACAGIFFLVQFFLFYHTKSERAVEEGKRMIVAVETGEILIRSPEADKKPEPEKKAETEAVAPVAPVAPITPDAPAPEKTPPKKPAEQPAPADSTAATPEKTPEETAAAAPDDAATPEPATEVPAKEAEAVIYDGKARLAVAISGLGLNRELTENVTKLPGGVTLSFSPYVANLENWVTAAKKSGHEVLLDLPMETSDYPLSDPGPMAILNDASKATNIQHLQSALNTGKDFVGLLTPVDETVTKSLSTILPLIDEMQKQKTLLIYNERPSNAFLRQESRAIGLKVIPSYVVIDDVLTPEAIDAKLEEVRKLILEDQKTILIVGHPYPLTIKRLEAWLAALKEKHGIEPSPVSTIINS